MANLLSFTKFANVSPRQSFPPYGTQFLVVLPEIQTTHVHAWVLYGGKLWWEKTLANLLQNHVWQNKIQQICPTRSVLYERRAKQYSNGACVCATILVVQKMHRYSKL